MRKLIAALMALTVFSAACSGTGAEEIGRVGETVFTIDDLTALYVEDWFDEAIVIDEARRTDLFRMLAIEALGQAAEEDFGFAPDPADVEASIDEARQQIEARDATVGDFLGVQGASEEMLRLNSEFGLIRRAVVLELIDDEAFLRELFDDGRGVTNVCVRHILTDNTDALDEAVARIEAGEDFAAVADEVSLDTGTAGGDLGCSIASRFVSPFANAAIGAEIGELTHPVETEFGFHALIVDERTAPTFEELVANPAEFVPESEADFLWADWFNDALREAEVEVSERFGSWTPVGITPPEE